MTQNVLKAQPLRRKMLRLYIVLFRAHIMNTIKWILSIRTEQL